jgi:hypothetical protein
MANAETVTVTFEMDAQRARSFLDALASDDSFRRKLLDREPGIAADALGEYGITVDQGALGGGRISLPEKEAVRLLRKAMKDAKKGDEDLDEVLPLNWCLCLSAIGFALGTLPDDDKGA